MNKWKSPDVPLISVPVNIDRPIQEIQIALAGLSWLERSFGRSWLALKMLPTSTGKRIVYYPQVWQGFNEEGKPRDMLEVLPNDNIKSQCFFKINDPVTVTEFVPNGDSQMRAILDIIFWFNYKALDDTIDYPFIELLKGQAQRVLAGMSFSPDSFLSIVRIWEGAANVFKGYDMTDVHDYNLVYPWGGFRFECELTYREDCPYNTLELNNAPPGYIMANGGFILRS
jgi:hypothetical protein